MRLRRWADGTPIKRSYIRELLGAAAVRAGYPRERMGVHALRVGGATALWVSSGGSEVLVRRMGRWNSDAYHTYLWDLPTLTIGTTRAMLQANTSVPWGDVLKGVKTE